MNVENRLPIVIIAVALLCSGCAATSPSGDSPETIATPSNDALLGVQWRVEDINGAGVIDRSNTSFTLLPDGRLAGLPGCNNFSAVYALNRNSLTFDTIISTRKACVPALNNQEQRFLKLLEATDRYQFDQTGALILKTHDGRHIKARRQDS